MNFFEELAAAAGRSEDAGVARLVLGWHASFVLAEDGRWGVGFVPDSMKEAHTARSVHTGALIGASLSRLAGLYVSPFPQEFAAATAACAALLPFRDGGLPLDLVMPDARGDRVAVLGYERDLLPFMRDWGWRVAVFDDRVANRPDCFPQEDFSRGVSEAEWVWLSSEAIRDRWLLSTREALLRKKGCFLQGPGLPSLPRSFKKLGVTHLVVPSPVEESSEVARTVEAHVAAGGSPWLCEELVWRVHAAQGL
ncbi:MAG: hypothetical protein IJ702_07040 [Fretibacterium sp.]|nr:hypothetical protein [Fretibacterium sp.]